MPTRRAFVGGAAAAATVAFRLSGAETPSVEHGAIRRRRIPKTGELVPMIGLGTSRTFDTPKVSDALVEVMRGFLDAGGSVVDSSPMYGEAERVVGELLRRLGRDDLFLASKVWTDEGKDAGLAQVAASERLMRTRRLDLMQVHNLVDWEVELPMLQELKGEGRLRYVGITEMRDWPLVVELIEKGDLDFVQVPYSIAEREVEERVLPAAEEHGVAVLVMRPFHRGRLFESVRGQAVPEFAAELECTSWAQLFLKFVLGHPAVTCPIPATSKPRHLADNMRAGIGPLPDEAMRRRIAQAVSG